MPPVAEQAEWLDVKAAEYLDFHPDTICRMIREGGLAALRFPVRIRREDVDACVEGGRIMAGELSHLNAHAAGAHLAAERGVTKAGKPDRRYGPRQVRGAASCTGDRATAFKAATLSLLNLTAVCNGQPPPEDFMTELTKGERMGRPVGTVGRGGTGIARWTRFFTAMVVAVGAAMGAGAAAGALAAVDDALIHACVQQPQGSLRVTTDPSRCRSSEKALSWHTGGVESRPDAGGPRVGAVTLTGAELRLQVTAPVLAGSVTLDAFAVTLWLDVPGEWRTLPLTVAAVDGARTGIRVGLGEAVPAEAWLRVIVRGTGPNPVLGEDHVPLAGVLGGPPGTAAAGQDAVVFRPVADLVP